MNRSSSEEEDMYSIQNKMCSVKSTVTEDIWSPSEVNQRWTFYHIDADNVPVLRQGQSA